MPRWVKISALVAAVLALLVVVVVALGGGNHGPGRHLGGDDAGAPAAAPEGHSPPEGGHAPPPGGH